MASAVSCFPDRCAVETHQRMDNRGGYDYYEQFSNRARAVRLFLPEARASWLQQFTLDNLSSIRTHFTFVSASVSVWNSLAASDSTKNNGSLHPRSDHTLEFTACAHQWNRAPVSQILTRQLSKWILPPLIFTNLVLFVFKNIKLKLIVGLSALTFHPATSVGVVINPSHCGGV